MKVQSGELRFCHSVNYGGKKDVVGFVSENLKKNCNCRNSKFSVSVNKMNIYCQQFSYRGEWKLPI